MQVDYQVTRTQPWAAFTLRVDPQNYQGYKPVLQFWLKGSGSRTVDGMIKLRTQNTRLDQAALIKKNGHPFSLKQPGWQLIKLPLSTAEAEQLDHLGFIDIVFYSSGRPEFGTLFLDDVLITYSVL